MVREALNPKRCINHRLTIQSHQYRLGVFADNVATIEAHNAGDSSFKLGMNQFTGMTNAEYRKTMLSEVAPEVPSTMTHASVNPAAASADWRQQGAVTDVKDQGQCGSCWAFSTTGSLEGAWEIAGNTLTALSEQELLDCSGSYGNYGCQGGLMDNAFKYIINAGGLSTEASYPYQTRQGTCQSSSATQGATMTAFTDIAQGSESDLQNAVGTVGPVSIAIDASHSSFQMYHSGVYNEPACSSTQLDHGVLAVGYGTDKGKDYWIVKNSWSTVWGNQGYIEMSRNNNNNCGVASAASYPTIN